jgi:hypothetical protein
VIVMTSAIGAVGGVVLVLVIEAAVIVASASRIGAAVGDAAVVVVSSAIGAVGGGDRDRR